MHAVPGMHTVPVRALAKVERKTTGGLSVGQCGESSGICVPLANLERYVYV
jgi:hypothetical protein